MNKKIQSSIINIPVNADVDKIVFHYRALFNAHGVKNNLPDVKVPMVVGFENPIKATQETLERDFKEIDLELYRLKNTYGNVEITDMKIVGNKAHIFYQLG